MQHIIAAIVHLFTIQQLQTLHRENLPVVLRQPNTTSLSNLKKTCWCCKCKHSAWLFQWRLLLTGSIHDYEQSK